MPLAIGVLVKTSGPIVWGGRRLNDSYDPTVRDCSRRSRRARPHRRLDRRRRAGGAQPNAADFQIAPSSAAADDLRGPRARRSSAGPAGQHAMRFLPQAPGPYPAGLPGGVARASAASTAPSCQGRNSEAAAANPAAMEIVELQRTLVKSAARALGRAVLRAGHQPLAGERDPHLQGRGAQAPRVERARRARRDRARALGLGHPRAGARPRSSPRPGWAVCSGAPRSRTSSSRLGRCWTTSAPTR